MRDPRSISTPITLTAVAALLSTALLVAWTIILAGEDSPTWLLVLGIISFAVITAVLVVFGFALAREILQARRQSAFIDSVTHELKSPLASLKLCLSTLERPELSDAQRSELQSVMNKDIDRLSMFIDDVLEASRIAYGGSPAERIELAQLIDRCVQRVVRRHGVDGNAVTVTVEPGDLAVFSDMTSLETILKNLIDNAVKYSDPPHHVAVDARDDGRNIVIAVQDEGIGIPPEDLERIFSRFYRVSSEEVRSRKGTGLGLFVVDSMARRLGGRIRADSRGEGYGTRMELLLPRELSA